MRPLRQIPRLVRPLWGGDTLARAWGKGAGTIGESWEVWGENVVIGADARFAEVAALPLLVKLLDVRERLSVQVHPDDATARGYGLPHGKSEGWVILHAEPGARVAVGLRHDLTATELAERARDGRIEDDLDWRSVREGDVFDVPAGTVHVIGAGVVLYEVQQPIDVTYRLYDWGRARELHLARGVASARPGPPAPRVPARVLDESRTLLLDTRYFSIERRVEGLWRARTWEAVTVVRGTLHVGGEDIGFGETVCLPPGEWRACGDGACLVALPGERVAADLSSV